MVRCWHVQCFPFQEESRPTLSPSSSSPLSAEVCLLPDALEHDVDPCSRRSGGWFVRASLADLARMISKPHDQPRTEGLPAAVGGALQASLRSGDGPRSSKASKARVDREGEAGALAGDQAEPERGERGGAEGHAQSKVEPPSSSNARSASRDDDGALDDAIAETLHAVEALEQALRRRDADIDRLEIRCAEAERRLCELRDDPSCDEAGEEIGRPTDPESLGLRRINEADAKRSRPGTGVLAALVSGTGHPRRTGDAAPSNGKTASEEPPLGGSVNGARPPVRLAAVRRSIPLAATSGAAPVEVEGSALAESGSVDHPEDPGRPILEALAARLHEQGGTRHEIERALDHQTGEVSRIRRELNRISDRIWAARQGTVRCARQELESLVRRESSLIAQLKDARRLSAILQSRLSKANASEAVEE